MKKIISKSLDNTSDFASEFLKTLNKKETALVVGLYGNLGSGKTTFTKAAAKILNIKEDVTSPTYVIEKFYDIKDGVFNKLIHIDAYRLDSGNDLRKLGFEKEILDPNNLIFIEWPEKVADILPSNHKKIIFTVIDDNTREIEVE